MKRHRTDKTDYASEKAIFFESSRYTLEHVCDKSDVLGWDDTELK